MKERDKITSGGTSIKIWEAARKNGGVKKMCAKHAKIDIFAIFYADIVKFGQIQTHLSWGGGEILGGNSPMAPCSTTSEDHFTVGVIKA